MAAHKASLNSGGYSGENVGAALKTLRTARGESLRSLAGKAGISAAALSRWESQKRVPNIPELEAVCSALEATTAQKQVILRLINAPRAVQRLRALDETGIAAVGSRGDLLWAMRQHRGWTQTETARAAGVTQSQIAEWEGGGSWPDAAVVHKLCWHLKAQTEEVVALSDSDYLFPEAPLREAQGAWDNETWSHYVSELLYRPPPMELVDLTLIATERQLSLLATTDPARSAFAVALLADLYAVHARHHYHRRQRRQAAHWAERGLALVRRRELSVSSEKRAGGGSLWFASVLALASYTAQSDRPADLRRAVGIISEWLPAVEHSDPTHYTWGQMNLANYLARLGRADEAVFIGRAACKTVEYGSDAGDTFMRRRDYAGLLMDIKEPAQALRALRQSEKIVNMHDLPGDTLARHHLMEAACFQALGDAPGADERVRRAERIITEQQLWYLQDDLRHATDAL